MKKALTAVLVGALLLIPTQSVSAHSRQELNRRHQHCRYASYGDTWRHWTETEVRMTLGCVLDHNARISRSHAIYIADRESSFYAYARNTSSGACGVYQHMPRYWPSRAATFGFAGASCFNARANIMVTIRMVKQGGWGPWGG